MLFIIYLMIMSINLMNTCDGSQETGYIEDEIVQRRMLHNEKKKNLDQFQMKKKETFVVTPPFEHKVVNLDERTSGTLDGTLESHENKAAKMDDKRKPQQDQPSDKSVAEKRVYYMDEMDDSGRPDVSDAVRKPFQHKGVPSDKSIAENRGHWMDEMDDSGRPDVSHVVRKPFQHKGVSSDKSIADKRAHWTDEMDDSGRPDVSHVVGKPFQHKDVSSDKSIAEKRAHWTDEMDDSGRPDVSHVVRKPFQHKDVSSDKSIAEKRAHWTDEMDDSGRPDVSYAINDKDDYNTNGIEGNEYGNDPYDAYYDDDDTNPPNTPQYNAQEKLAAVMDVLSKQNVMVEKLIDLYQSEMSNKQFEKLIDSINRKQYLQFLKTRRPSDTRTGDKKHEGIKEEKKVSKEKAASKEKKMESKEKKEESKEKKEEHHETHNGPEIVNNIIRIDETQVKKKLAKDPFVKRILDMAKWKKKMYIKKKKQEEELERAEEG